MAVVVAPAAVPHFPEFGFLAGRADELVLWRCGLPTAKFRMPAPVPAATCVSNSSFESLVELVEVDRELVVHIEGDQDTDLRKLHTPIDIRVAGEDRLDLSPLYLWRGRRVPRAGGAPLRPALARGAALGSPDRGTGHRDRSGSAPRRNR
ncbi:hypothetical protein AB0383_45050 [Amycolatopsis sp. NPDC051373]|uniref:hypothetical protein n=1 Tax=Amycolatopsis sp. NPDC051373 TaxID=3155801 RepID=UPI00344FA7DA